MEALTRVEISKILIRDIFLHCDRILFEGNQQSVEFIMKYPKTFPDNIYNQAIDEFHRQREKIYFSLDYDILDLLCNGGWEK